jgi:hypothetical protein
MDPKDHGVPEDLPEVLQEFLASAAPPAGQGNANFEWNRTALLMVVPFLPYLLGFLPFRIVPWLLVAYSVLVVGVYCVLIARFKSEMAYESNPFDFVTVELLNLLTVVLALGVGYHFLSTADSGQFNRALGLLDGVYFSMVTIATLGYGDIHPVLPMSKSLALAEVAVGVWFFITVIPVAVADQAERLRHYRVHQENMKRALAAAIEKGEAKRVNLEHDSQ